MKSLSSDEQYDVDKEYGVPKLSDDESIRVNNALNENLTLKPLSEQLSESSTYSYNSDDAESNAGTDSQEIDIYKSDAKIMKQIKTNLENINEKPMYEIIATLSDALPMIQSADNISAMDNYLVNVLSTIKDNDGNPVFRDNTEIMNFIETLKTKGKKSRYKLPKKVNKKINNEIIINHTINPSVVKELRADYSNSNRPIDNIYQY